MPLSALIYFYRRRLRTHPVQETLAGLGVAVGVALVFAVQVATSSITSGTDQVVKSIVGSASLQLRSRSPSGVDERITDRVRALAGVQTAAPVLAMTADVRGPSGREATVQLVSADVSLGTVARRARVGGQAGPQPPSVLLPAATARRLGVSTRVGQELAGPPAQVTLVARGRAVPVSVAAVLGAEAAGVLSDAMAVIAPVRSIQSIAGLPR